jgi:hypothetical protein
MLYTKGFLLAGMLAVALTLTAGANAAERQAMTTPPRTPLRLRVLLEPSDTEALRRLSAALESHTVWRHELTEPAPAIAAHARSAAAGASEPTRSTLLSLAEAADRSALAFLVDYNLAAGGWEAATGVRMSSPAFQRL